jgi:hypothetical protein
MISSPTITETEPPSELPVDDSHQHSITGNTLTERSRSPSEWTEQPRQSSNPTGVLETDMHGFLLNAPRSASPTGKSTSWIEQQQSKLKEEKARLTRLQELSEMESRLEEQLQKELVEGR